MRRLPTLPSLLLLLGSTRHKCSHFLVDAASTSLTLFASGATVAGGLFHTCVIVSDLSLRCWGGGSAEQIALLAPSGSIKDGFGNFGQLGTGNNETLGDEPREMGESLPRVDLGGNTVQEVAAGQSHTCVLLTSGRVACFGYNMFGQLGLGDTSARGLSPADMGANLSTVDLGTDRKATHVSCGQYHSCAVLQDGGLKCWGWNEFGTLGVGDTADRGNSAATTGDNLPAVDLGTGQTAVAVAAGRFHTCAILGSGGLKCWGGNNGTNHNYGQLGQGNTWDVLSPGDDLPEIDLGEGRTVVALACGWYHTCVILDNAKLHCFGRNLDGQLGLGDTEDRGNKPNQMGDAMVNVNLGEERYPIAVTAGRWHTCVLLDNTDVKCFGANTADDLGAGQLGLEDAESRGKSPATTGDGLPALHLGSGREAGWVFSAYDHTCVIFSDFTTKCWGLNTSGQLGLGDTDDRGADPKTMGNFLPAVETGGLRLACPPMPPSFDKSVLDGGEEGGNNGGLSTKWAVGLSLVAVGGAIFFVGALCLCCRRRLEKQDHERRKAIDSFEANGFGFDAGLDDGSGAGSSRGTVHAAELETRAGLSHNMGAGNSRAGTMTTDIVLVKTTQTAQPGAEQPQQQLVTYPVKQSNERSPPPIESRRQNSVSNLSHFSGKDAGLAAAGTAGVAIAGGLAAGWNVIGFVAENLPWVGVAFHMLNEIADIVDSKNAMQGNMEKIRSWAFTLRDVLVQMGKQLQHQPTVNARALEHMSADVIINLQTLVETVRSYNAKGALAQYAASRSCQKAVDAADTALRGALVKLSVGQGAELMAMVGRLQGAGLEVNEKLDMVIEHLRKQEEHAARLELRLAAYSESMAEVLQQIGKGNLNGNVNGNNIGNGHPPHTGKTLSELGKEQLDKLQISSEDVSYPSNLPFASGTYSEVYQVIHEGVIKAAKKTNLARLGVGGKNINRVFERFVRELYILSQMHSERVVSVYGAIASPTEMTLVMEFVERGSIRTILDDDSQRMALTRERQNGLLVDTAEGMTYLYKNGVEHRDLKSANCLVTHDWRVKITDFGLSKTNDAISTGSNSTASSQFRGGTVVYMAPELLPGGAGREVPAELSDVYSYGVIVWDVICADGELPWAGVSMNELLLTLKIGTCLEIPDHCGRFFRKLMLNCWRRNPHRRPTFERVLKAVKKEAESPSDLPTTRSPSPPQPMPLPPTLQQADIRRESSCSPFPRHRGNPSIYSRQATGGSVSVGECCSDYGYDDIDYDDFDDDDDDLLSSRLFPRRASAPSPIFAAYARRNKGWGSEEDEPVRPAHVSATVNAVVRRMPKMPQAGHVVFSRWSSTGGAAVGPTQSMMKPISKARPRFGDSWTALPAQGGDQSNIRPTKPDLGPLASPAREAAASKHKLIKPGDAASSFAPGGAISTHPPARPDFAYRTSSAMEAAAPKHKLVKPFASQPTSKTISTTSQDSFASAARRHDATTPPGQSPADGSGDAAATVVERAGRPSQTSDDGRLSYQRGSEPHTDGNPSGDLLAVPRTPSGDADRSALSSSLGVARTRSSDSCQRKDSSSRLLSISALSDAKSISFGRTAGLASESSTEFFPDLRVAPPAPDDRNGANDEAGCGRGGAPARDVNGDGGDKALGEADAWGAGKEGRRGRKGGREGSSRSTKTRKPQVVHGFRLMSTS